MTNRFTKRLTDRRAVQASRSLLIGSIMSAVLLGSGITLRGQQHFAKYTPKIDVPIKGQPFTRYFTSDKFGREITFFLSDAADKGSPLPLVVYIHGSGCNSLFENRNGEVVPTSGSSTIQRITDGRERLLIVEKPGVAFLAQPSQGCDENIEFNYEHTLDRWAEAIEGAILAAHKLPLITKDKTLVIGHSEGGLVACRVARDLDKIVTHVATVAGGGPSQLFDLLWLGTKGYFKGADSDPASQAKYVLGEWAKIQADPMNQNKFFFGFSNRRWSTFLKSSPMDELKHFRSHIYIAQGTNDDAVDPVSADVLYSELIAAGANVIYDRVDDADHSFAIKGKPEINGWRPLHTRIIDWFVSS